jgi:hypothetical protein
MFVLKYTRKWHRKGALSIVIIIHHHRKTKSFWHAGPLYQNLNVSKMRVGVFVTSIINLNFESC